ncbi:GNAT family acetyltransferase [Pseudoclavibacter chungangensis]|uniref:GNAT family acetyltransferase n=1 Tax=Pseudoclavibacter chungangensis TaxID=587635 RepID=A0A7J5BR43_9MICO|nr:GNAT family acetyltransferase [Pseudoclavibacter chungangensis]KAB1654521.1 GNAT family acetyltransferase [Pseudoclavibacter chungangensis]NYJ68255.1 ribosomal protein S18 acetylase RimI-like enzyme [Pseudoclavibacter chungangensis]
MTIEVRAFRPDDADAVVDLWTESGLVRPWNDPRRDIARKLDVQPELFLVAIERTDGDDAPPSAGRARTRRDTVIGSVMAGTDGHRGWLYYLAVTPELRGRGIGRELVAAAERRLEALGCPKVQLMVRRENRDVASLYAELGYEESDVLVLGKRLIADD